MKIVITGDTHVPHLSDCIPPGILRAITSADLVLHTGDFNTRDSYEAFADGSKQLLAVRGNRDEGDLDDLLPQDLTVEIEGVKVALLHGHTYGRPRPSRLAREFGSESDMIVYGHLHRPAIVRFQPCIIINPGSPTAPRGSDPSYVRAHIENGQVAAEIIYLE